MPPTRAPLPLTQASRHRSGRLRSNTGTTTTGAALATPRLQRPRHQACARWRRQAQRMALPATQPARPGAAPPHLGVRPPPALAGPWPRPRSLTQRRPRTRPCHRGRHRLRACGRSTQTQRRAGRPAWPPQLRLSSRWPRLRRAAGPAPAAGRRPRWRWRALAQLRSTTGPAAAWPPTAAAPQLPRRACCRRCRSRRATAAAPGRPLAYPAECLRCLRAAWLPRPQLQQRRRRWQRTPTPGSGRLWAHQAASPSRGPSSRREPCAARVRAAAALRGAPPWRFRCAGSRPQTRWVGRCSAGGGQRAWPQEMAGAGLARGREQMQPVASVAALCRALCRMPGPRLGPAVACPCSSAAVRRTELSLLTNVCLRAPTPRPGPVQLPRILRDLSRVQVRCQQPRAGRAAGQGRGIVCAPGVILPVAHRPAGASFTNLCPARPRLSSRGD